MISLYDGGSNNNDKSVDLRMVMAETAGFVYVKAAIRHAR